MKFDLKKHAGTIFLILVAVYCILFICSCSAKYHENHFYKKGGSFKCDTTFIDVPKYIKGSDGKDSLIYVKEPCKCPDVETPLTNREIKRLDKKERDSLKRSERFWKDRNEFILDSLKEVRKSNKIEAKKDVKLSKQTTKQNKSNNKTKVKIESDNWKWYHYLFMILFLLLGWFLRGLWESIKTKYDE